MILFVKFKLFYNMHMIEDCWAINKITHYKREISFTGIELSVGNALYGPWIYPLMGDVVTGSNYTVIIM